MDLEPIPDADGGSWVPAQLYIYEPTSAPPANDPPAPLETGTNAGGLVQPMVSTQLASPKLLGGFPEEEQRRDKIELVFRHGGEAIHTFRLDRLMDADLAVTEVLKQAKAANSARPIRFVGYKNRDLRRLTEHTWSDAMSFLAPAEEGAVGGLDKLNLIVQLEADVPEAVADCVEEEPTTAGEWEVQTDAGWKRFKPGKRFKGEAGEEIFFWMHERKYRASFTTAFEGIQVNLSTLRSRSLRKVIGSAAESQDWFDDGPEDGVYKVLLKSGDNPKSMSEQLNWEVCAHRVQATDKRDGDSTYLMLSKPHDGKTGAGRSCNHFEFTRIGKCYRIAMNGGDGANTYDQVGWRFSSARSIGTDTRNAESTYASVARPTEGLQGSLFELKKFGTAYKIILSDGQGEQSGWEVCAHRSLPRDQRSKTTTYATLHRPAEGLTCNHFELQRVGGPLPISGVGAQIYGLDGELWGAVAGDEGGAWRLEGGRVAKKATEGSKWRWASPELAGPIATPAVVPAAVPAPAAEVATVPGFAPPSRASEVVGQREAAADDGFEVLEPPEVESCELHRGLVGSPAAAALVEAAVPARAGKDDEWAIVDK